MKESIEDKLQRLSHKNNFIEGLNEAINSISPEFLELFFQLFVKIVIVLILTYFLDEIFKRLLIPTIKRIIKNLLQIKTRKNRATLQLITLSIKTKSIIIC